MNYKELLEIKDGTAVMADKKKRLDSLVARIRGMAHADGTAVSKDEADTLTVDVLRFLLDVERDHGMRLKRIRTMTERLAASLAHADSNRQTESNGDNN